MKRLDRAVHTVTAYTGLIMIIAISAGCGFALCVGVRSI